jgi:hypothetical protein
MDRFVSDEGQRAMFVTFIKNHALPFLASVVKGDRRSAEQNRLQRLWCNEISEQWEGHSPEEVRGYCKLTIGVPILRASNDAFREQYDRVLKPLTYEQKFALMMEPLDLPVTRIMTKEQKTQYLDAIYRHFTEQGIVLTQPEAKAA